METKQIAYSLKSLKDGEIPVTGEMSTMLVKRGTTYKGTASLKEDAPVTFDVESEEENDPEESFTKRGKRTLAFSTFDYSPAVLAAYKGGEVVNGAWEEPTNAPEIERSFQLISKDGTLIEIPRGKLRSVFNNEMKEDGVALLENTVTVMKPKAPGVKSIRIRPYPKPVVGAGNAQNLNAANGNLAGTAVAGLGTIVKQRWNCVAKPEGAADPGFGTPTALNTTITGLVNGVYRFELTAVDSNEFESKASVTVTVAIA